MTQPVFCQLSKKIKLKNTSLNGDVWNIISVGIQWKRNLPDPITYFLHYKKLYGSIIVDRAAMSVKIIYSAIEFDNNTTTSKRNYSYCLFSKLRVIGSIIRKVLR